MGGFFPLYKLHYYGRLSSCFQLRVVLSAA